MNTKSNTTSNLLFDQYQEQAIRTANIRETKSLNLMNATMGLCGEAGEFAEHVKKYCFHNHDLSTEVIMDELGDVLWYVAYAAHTAGISLEDIAKNNVNKLQKRYPEGFDSRRSITRPEI